MRQRSGYVYPDTYGMLSDEEQLEAIREGACVGCGAPMGTRPQECVDCAYDAGFDPGHVLEQR